MRLKVTSESCPLSGFEQSLSHWEFGRHWEICHVLPEYRRQLAVHSVDEEDSGCRLMFDMSRVNLC